MKKKQKKTLDLVIKICKKNAFYGKKVIWKTHIPKIYKLSTGARCIEDLLPSFEYIFNILEDNHAHIRYVKDSKVLIGYKKKKNKSTKNRLNPELSKLVISQKFKIKLLANNIGYLRIPDIHPKNKQKQAKIIRKGLTYLSNQNVENWIIDLRYNTGGHFESMISGISPLFDNGIIAKVVTRKNKCIGRAKIKKRKFSYFNTTTIKLPKKEKVKSKKISILTSRFTASSGELLAVCFKGKDNTLFIGESTAGKTTNTNVQNIKDQILLILSTGIFSDMNDHIYTNNIPVDVPIRFDPLLSMDQDPAIFEAKKWCLGT